MRKDSSKEKQVCFVHRNCEGDFIKGAVRAEVCHQLPADYKDDAGNYYCILHFPDDNKHNNTNFLSVMRHKLEHNQPYFQHVYFPGGGVLSRRTFKYGVNFNHAIFSSDAYFNDSEFKGRSTFINSHFMEKAEFSRVKFSQEVDFTSAEFNQAAFFSSATFNETVSFKEAIFTDEAYFRNAKFLKKTNFDKAQFNKRTDFYYAYFSELAEFNATKFHEETYFTSATFSKQAHFYNSDFSKNVSFSGATFSDNVFFDVAEFADDAKVSFDKTVFDKAVCSFFKAKISGYIHFVGGNRAIINDGKASFKEGTTIKESEKTGFIGNESHLDMQHAYIEKPERITFYNMHLQPSWFIHVDCKKFVFTNCLWTKSGIKKLWVESELESLTKRCIEYPHYLLARSCWQLADNQEETKYFSNASQFRFMALESKRLYYNKGFKVWSLHWWYWLSSFYGEYPIWAFIILLTIIFIFAAIFTGVNFQVCPIDKTITENPCLQRPLEFWEAVRHSLATATFQNVEFRKPASGWGEFWIFLEKILAPVQAALLALAIRRKFMR
ncbi:MAG: pentapeptide repeat-containing protein [Pyrinomonadaceae bacterium]